VPPLSRRSYFEACEASSWEEIWEAGPYYDRISELLEDATRSAVFVGWQIDSRLPLKRPVRPNQSGDSNRETLKTKLVRLCDEKPDLHIYLLMWDHAYFYVMERETWAGRVWEDVHERVHFVFDNRHPFGGSHHEKLAIIDGKTAFCGGIDLCDERWDSRQHLFNDPRRSLDWKREHHEPYHDLAVQVKGPVVAELHEHVAERWRRLSTVPFVEPASSPALHGDSGHRVYISRTLAMIDAGDAAIEHHHPITREIEFMFRDLIRLAERELVFEGQYYWSSEINQWLIDKMHAMRGRDFTIFLALADLRTLKSLTRHMAEYQGGLLAALDCAAAETGTRLIMGSPYAYSRDPASFDRPKAVYIHSKIVICDDRYLSIGTANLAARALRVDTEVNLTLEARTDAERAHVRRVRDQVYRHWGLTPEGHDREGADVRLHRFHPAQEMRTYHRTLWPGFGWIARFPWQKCFDPVLPWLHPIKRRFRLVGRRHRAVTRALAGSAWLLGGLAAYALARWLEVPAGGLTAAFALTLASAWLLPVPFTLTALWATLVLGPLHGGALAASGLWIASLWGYLVTRMFPTASGRYYRAAAPRFVSRLIGQRRFSALVSVVFDPRASLRTKIAFQGLYCVPIPWFALVNWVVLPAALLISCRVAYSLSPEPLVEAARRLAPACFALAAGFIGFKWKKST
jgi:phosphatidylserine/phosphatidylglycerophosphate/cardiolipin synthase-like enzyme/uncharacterized membrane protein YdjX (TVP38/TMEM64 family)